MMCLASTQVSIRCCPFCDLPMSDYGDYHKCYNCGYVIWKARAENEDKIGSEGSDHAKNKEAEQTKTE